jgi:hypothetical protein
VTSFTVRRPGMGYITSHRESAERYAPLRFVGVIFTGLGAILLAVGSLLLAYGLYTLLSSSTVEPPGGGGPGPFPGRPVTIGPFAGGTGTFLLILWSSALLIAGLQSLAMGSLFRLVINVEENTRISAQCLEKLRSRSEGPIGQNIGSLFRD